MKTVTLLSSVSGGPQIPLSLCCLDLYQKHRSSCLHQSFKEDLSVRKFTSNTTPDTSAPSVRLPQLTYLDPEGPAQIFFSQKPALIVWFTEEIIERITLTKFLLILLKLCQVQWWGYVWCVIYMLHILFIFTICYCSHYWKWLKKITVWV